MYSKNEKNKHSCTFITIIYSDIVHNLIEEKTRVKAI